MNRADWLLLVKPNNRVVAPESLTSPRTGRYAFPIWTPEEVYMRPYAFVEALRRLQGGLCGCGKCEVAHRVGTERIEGFGSFGVCSCGWRWEASTDAEACERARMHSAWYRKC